MNFITVGAGAIDGYIGGRLDAAGERVFRSSNAASVDDWLKRRFKSASG
jgi:ketopantoate reductase